MIEASEGAQMEKRSRNRKRFYHLFQNKLGMTSNIADIDRLERRFLEASKWVFLKARTRFWRGDWSAVEDIYYALFVGCHVRAQIDERRNIEEILAKA